MCGVLRYTFAAVLVFVTWQIAAAQTQPPADTGSSGPTAAGDVLKVGGSVSPPRVTYAPDPEYSEEARRDKFQGTCVLWLVVGPDGMPHNIKVARALGHGLDEKAIEAVRQWKFQPALKNGEPVAVQVNVEVTFHLYGYRLAKKIQELERRANTGDAKAELELSQAYFKGKGAAKDETAGYRLLQRAANRGLPKAQFQMGEYAASHGDGPEDNIVACMWYGLAGRNHYKHSDKRLKELAARMSPENVAEAQKRAQEWRPAR
jgi:TonB family protein